jgi:LacI family transcriptional regulator
VDGLIVASRMPIGVIAALQEKNIKFVWVNNAIPHENICSVIFDKSAMYLKIVRRISDLGFQKVAFVSPVTSQEDCNLFTNLCANSKISLKTFAYDTVSKSDKLQQTAVEDTLKILSSPEKPESIVSAGEIATTGVLQAIFSKGLRVPDDIHILSISEQESFQWRTPVPIDVLVQSFSDLAREATLMLHDMLKGKSPDPHIKYLPVNGLKQSYEN